MVIGIWGKENIHQNGANLENNYCPLVQTDKLWIYGNKEHKDIVHWQNADKSSGFFFYGSMFNLHEILPDYSIEWQSHFWGEYLKQGSDLIARLSGQFILIVWQQDSVKIFRDQIGVQTVYYSSSDTGCIFGTNLNSVADFTPNKQAIEPSSLVHYLVYNYNPGVASFYQDVMKLRPGYVFEQKDASHTVNPYWQVEFSPKIDLSENEIGGQIRSKLEAAVLARLGKETSSSAFLSGGLDSSSIVSLLSQSGIDTLNTYSFRCKSESFDESPFAQKVADTFHTNHRLVEYKPEDVLLAEEMVESMDEPFCDVGINIATYLLAKSLGNVNTLFTGDGGDELFAGHPVYLADKSAALFRFIPPFVRAPVFAWGKMLSDSDKKKDWRVKIKRFSESYAYPAALGTHRWRAYYTPDGLENILHPDIYEKVMNHNPFEEMIGFNEEIQNEDVLSQSLYSDYQTVTQFYLRRMDLTRKFGASPRFPMLDADLVQYCARIPSQLKIKGWSHTKYIEKIAVEPLLPHEIVYRKDKLGHSIPLKNWMREHPKVQEMMFDLLSESVIKQRGYFNPESVQKMIQSHLNKQVNHSHRLWALMILELWLRKKESGK